MDHIIPEVFVAYFLGIILLLNSKFCVPVNKNVLKTAAVRRWHKCILWILWSAVADSLVCTSNKSVELCLCRTHEEV